MRKSYVYILTNITNKVLYIGVTSDIVKRVYEHKEKHVNSFSSKYNLNKLVYYEIYDDIQTAIEREKQLKNWKREWKEELICKNNSRYEDLYESIL